MKEHDYLFINISEQWEELERRPASKVEQLDKVVWEKIYHELPKNQLELLVCLYLGFRPKEIVKILGYKNEYRYHNLKTKLMHTYEKIKLKII